MTKLYKKAIWILWVKEGNNEKQIRLISQNKKAVEALKGTNTVTFTYEIEESYIYIDMNKKLYTENQEIWEYVKLRENTKYAFE